MRLTCLTSGWRGRALALALVGLAATAGQATTVKVDLGVSANSTRFGKARIANGCIERLHYGLKCGGFATKAPCDFSGYTFKFAADNDPWFARAVSDSGSSIIAWKSPDGQTKTGSWSKWSTASYGTSGNEGQYRATGPD